MVIDRTPSRATVASRQLKIGGAVRIYHECGCAKRVAMLCRRHEKQRTDISPPSCQTDGTQGRVPHFQAVFQRKGTMGKVDQAWNQAAACERHAQESADGKM